MARLAKSLETLRNQFNKDYPARSRASDGWIGDPAHRARKSDHNPNSAGVVLALDITHDPKHGVDTYKIAEHMRSMKDPRIDYVISNGRIFSSTVKPWIWRKYSGSNPHSKHIHVSVKKDAKNYDATNHWNLGSVGTTVPEIPEVVSLSILRKGSEGDDVRKLQRLLGLEADGSFGPNTHKAVVAFQKANKITADGIVGEYTWELLNRPIQMTSTGLVTKPKPQWGKDILMGLGWKDFQAAAAMGHAQQESYKDLRTAVVGDQGTAFGIIQWRKDRYDSLKKFAAARDQVWTDFETQVRFIDYELRTTEKFAGNKLFASTNVEEAVTALMHYVRSAGYKKDDPTKGHGYANRLKNAKALV